MAAKHFIINTEVSHLSKEDVEQIEGKKISVTSERWANREKKAKEAFEQECNLKHTFGRVVIVIDIEEKNYHTFSDGTKIRRERQFNEFNRRITQPVNATVISGENIPKGSEILISHNAVHDTNRIFSYKSSSPDIQYFSIPEYDCFAWRDTDGELKPMKNYDFALRVFKPYQGMIIGQPPTEIKDTLYVTTGKLKGNVVKTLIGSDYVVIYQNTDGKEGQLIRFRPFGDPDSKREEEAIALLNEFTENVEHGKLLIGITTKDCKTLKEYYGKNT